VRTRVRTDRIRRISIGRSGTHVFAQEVATGRRRCSCGGARRLLTGDDAKSSGGARLDEWAAPKHRAQTSELNRGNGIDLWSWIRQLARRGGRWRRRDLRRGVTGETRHEDANRRHRQRPRELAVLRDSFTLTERRRSSGSTAASRLGFAAMARSSSARVCGERSGTVQGGGVIKGRGARVSGPEATRARGASLGSDPEFNPSTARGGG
jgi:hypothetical protein